MPSSTYDYNEKDFHDDSSVEKNVVHAYVVPPNDSRYEFDSVDIDRVQRRLKQRHVQMIAIAGTIGTGLFLGSGHALAGAGPIGALIAYALVSTVAYASLCAVGEMTSLAPISGTYPHFAARWVDPALGFAVGWNCFYSTAITIPVEVTAASILISYWDPNPGHAAIYLAVISVFVCMINIFGVRWFGESEFVFSIIKLILITGLIIVGLVIDLGGGPNHERIGFKYWHHPGIIAGAGLVKNINMDRFLGIISVLVQAAFSFQGMELVAIAASETENPRRNISKAVRRVFFRILVFYMLGILITGMLVPYDDPDLLHSTGTAAQSPYVIAISRAGIKALPSIINAAILTSAFSATNSYLFCGSRILYGLALRGQAPRYLTYCTKQGLPLAAVLSTAIFVLLCFLTLGSSASQVFSWLQNLTTVGGFFSWGAINITYIFFYRGLRAQGIDRSKIVYNNRFQPYLAYWGVFWNAFFILVNGFEVFFTFTTAGFLTAYLNIPIFLGLFVFWKLYKRTKVWQPMEMDFVTGIPTLEETDMPYVAPTTFWGKVAEFCF